MGSRAQPDQDQPHDQESAQEERQSGLLLHHPSMGGARDLGRALQTAGPLERHQRMEDLLYLFVVWRPWQRSSVKLRLHERLQFVLAEHVRR